MANKVKKPIKKAVVSSKQSGNKKTAVKKLIAKKPVKKSDVRSQKSVKKPIVKKPVVKKPVVKKPVVKKPVVKKPVAKKPVAKKPVAKKPVAKKPVAKKPVAKKPVAKKPVAKKPVAKKPVAKKPAVKKPVAKKTAPKQEVVKKVVAKKPEVKKVEEKKPEARKGGSRKAPPAPHMVSEEKRLNFKPGQKIFHFWYGAGVIEKKTTEIINGQKKNYLVLVFTATDVRYSVPEDYIEKVNIRAISNIKDLDEAIASLQSNVTKPMNFKAIENECQTKITSGKLIDVVDVIKVIYKHRKKQEKLGKISPLSTSFEKLLQTAKRLFASEWAVLKGLTYETCQQKINKIIDQYIKID